LNVLTLDVALDDPGPKGSIGIFLFDGKKKMESCLIPLGSLGVDLLEELKLEGILFISDHSLEFEVSGGEIDFFFLYVHEGDLDEEFIFALSPLNQRMKPRLV